MLGVDSREIVRRRYEWSVKSPAHNGELTDALYLASTKLAVVAGPQAVDYDDALTIEARDDEIVVYFEREDDR